MNNYFISASTITKYHFYPLNPSLYPTCNSPSGSLSPFTQFLIMTSTVWVIFWKWHESFDRVRHPALLYKLKKIPFYSIFFSSCSHTRPTAVSEWNAMLKSPIYAGQYSRAYSLQRHHYSSPNCTHCLWRLHCNPVLPVLFKSFLYLETRAHSNST